jgi:hypothetical protein
MCLHPLPRLRGDDVIDLDCYDLQPCMRAWGRPVTYYSSTEPPLELLAVFDDKYCEETLQSMVGAVVAARPMLGLRAASLPGGRMPTQGELFAFDGHLYAVSNPGGTRRAWPCQGAAAVRVRRGSATGRMTRLAIDIPRVTDRVLKTPRTLAGDAVEAGRIDGVASGDMLRRPLFWREEGEDVSGGSGPPAFTMELPLTWCRHW